MSNWGRNYNTNRNQNICHDSYHNYPQIDENGTYENQMNYGIPQNTGEVYQSGPPNSSLSNCAGAHNREAIFTEKDCNITGENGAEPPMYNIEINDEIWARAANSQLTPTAGEFIPSSTYHSSSTSHLQGASQPNQQFHTQIHNSVVSQHNEVSLRSNVTSDSNRTNTTQQDTAYQQRRNYHKIKNQNTDNQRNFNIEKSKAEGRKKLLQEAAGLVSTKNDASSSSIGNNSSPNQPTRWQFRGSFDTVFNTDSRIENNKRQGHHGQPQHYLPPKKSSGNGRGFSRGADKRVDYTVSQRDRLMDQLNRGTLECLVCCEYVRQTDHTWCCNNCYHVLHLRCIIKWANTSKSDNGWRCPACQNVTLIIPQDYHCFCGKAINPEWNHTDTAHSCGEVCNRPKVLASEHYTCVHRCTLLCHPGPCPPCVASVMRKCGCSKSSQSVPCGQILPLLCNDMCGKPLTCGYHQCKNKCHIGECSLCEVLIHQDCFCGKEHREIRCDGKHCEGEKFTCGNSCDEKLSCEHHSCERTCHDGKCGLCPRDPAIITHCHCGKTPLTEDQQRLSCLDPIPTCGQVCGKLLPCGQPSSPHQCKILCHEGPCPPCDLSTLVRCRCGFMDQEIPCTDLVTKADNARCKKKCTKKRTCGKHKCNQMCCIDEDHVCPLPCNHMLNCGQHRCDQLCHRGHCQPCLRSSFQELYCECGSSVLLPPIPCGTKPPPCTKPCSRRHECDHEVLHLCHSFTDCPPCGVLTSKYCHGKHELRKAVPCYMKEFSCGRPCNQPLKCGRHKCIQPCHCGECPSTCRQPCTKPRDLCGHPCNAFCHDGDCVDTPCKENVVVTCECGHRSMSRPCYENNSEYQRIATSLLASKMADVQLGRSVHLDDMQGPRKVSIKTLDCTEECRVVERNRRLAIGLQIRNPDLSAKLTPRYSDFMRAWAKKDQRFCQHVHDKLTELVKLAKESKQKSRSYSFETMNRDKRQFVHEYCAHFGCESVAYDAEPKRNVVATAQRDKAWLPSYSLLEVVQREMGIRKVPLPTLNSSSQKPPQRNALPVRVALSQHAKSQATTDSLSPIDYFDYCNS